jgi:benzylsuccinate CoA-transferase BbsF subunit
MFNILGQRKGERGIFEGLTIVSFSWAVVGPLTMKYFADHGATVIKVESSKRPDVLRTSPPFKDGNAALNSSGYFNHFNANILSMALDMKHSAARDLVGRLVEVADVVMENFTPGVMERLGLDCDELRKIKNELIILRQSGFGPSGPYSQLSAFGMILSAIAGFPNFIGQPGKGPLPPGVAAYTDSISPRFAAAALVAALDYRNKTGKGQVIDISQFETALHFILPAVLDYASNDREPELLGNASHFAVPHGVFPCKGIDRWCTISVHNDEEWSQLCKVISKPEYIMDGRFSTLLGRKKHEDQINRFITEWTENRASEEVVKKMQAAGVPAGMVMNAADIYRDSHLRERHFFWEMDHIQMEKFTHLGEIFSLSQTPARPFSPSPCLGEHTEMICTKLLKISDEEFVELVQSGLLE